MKRSSLPNSQKQRQFDEQTMDDMLREFDGCAAGTQGYELSPTRLNQQQQMINLPSRASIPASLSPARANLKGKQHMNIVPYQKFKDHALDKSIKMGAQAFPETDYAPTEMQEANDNGAYHEMDMDVFRDLQSDMGARSELQRNKIAQIKKKHSVALPKQADGFGAHFMSGERPHGKFGGNAFGKEKKSMANDVTLESILDPNAAAAVQHAESHQEYSVSFRIPYQTNLGESLAIIGDIEELGAWKDFSKGQMKWTEGHIWVIENLKIRSKHFFSYKYVLLKDDNPSCWEKGENRLADLRLMPDQRTQDQLLLGGFDLLGGNSKSQQSQIVPAAKHVEFNDVWQAFSVQLLVANPMHSEIAVSGFDGRFGSLRDPAKLRQGIKPDYITNQIVKQKYGSIKEANLCGKSYSFKWEEKPLKELPQKIEYQYWAYDAGFREERGAKRSVIVQPAEKYSGIQRVGEAFILNGSLNLFGGNFMGSQFKIRQVPARMSSKMGNLLLGNMPFTPDEFQQLRNSSVNSILAVNAKGTGFGSQGGIQVYHHALSEIDESESIFDLLQCVKRLEHLLSVDKQTVFLCCPAGSNDSPTVALAYLCYHKRIESWESPSVSLDKLRSTCGQGIQPNMTVVAKFLAQNQKPMSVMSRQRSPEQSEGPKSSIHGKPVSKFKYALDDGVTNEKEIQRSMKHAPPKLRSEVSDKYFEPAQRSEDLENPRVKVPIPSAGSGPPPELEPSDMPQPHLEPYVVEAESRKFQESFMDEEIDEAHEMRNYSGPKNKERASNSRGGTENNGTDIDDVRSRCSAPWEYESQGNNKDDDSEEDKYLVVENQYKNRVSGATTVSVVPKSQYSHEDSPELNQMNELKMELEKLRQDNEQQRAEAEKSRLEAAEKSKMLSQLQTQLMVQLEEKNVEIKQIQQKQENNEAHSELARLDIERQMNEQKLAAQKQIKEMIDKMAKLEHEKLNQINTLKTQHSEQNKALESEVASLKQDRLVVLNQAQLEKQQYHKSLQEMQTERDQLTSAKSQLQDELERQKVDFESEKQELHLKLEEAQKEVSAEAERIKKELAAKFRQDLEQETQKVTESQVAEKVKQMVIEKKNEIERLNWDMQEKLRQAEEKLKSREKELNGKLQESQSQAEQLMQMKLEKMDEVQRQNQMLQQEMEGLKESNRALEEQHELFTVQLDEHAVLKESHAKLQQDCEDNVAELKRERDKARMLQSIQEQLKKKFDDEVAKIQEERAQAQQLKAEFEELKQVKEKLEAERSELQEQLMASRKTSEKKRPPVARSNKKASRAHSHDEADDVEETKRGDHPNNRNSRKLLRKASSKYFKEDVAQPAPVPETLMQKLKRIADEKRLQRLRAQRGSKLAMSDIGAMAEFSDFEFRKDDDQSQVDEESLIDEQETQLRKPKQSAPVQNDAELQKQKEAQKLLLQIQRQLQSQVDEERKKFSEAAEREQSTQKELLSAKQQLAELMKRLTAVETNAKSETQGRDAKIKQVEQQLQNEQANAIRVAEEALKEKKQLEEQRNLLRQKEEKLKAKEITAQLKHEEQQDEVAKLRSELAQMKQLIASERQQTNEMAQNREFQLLEQIEQLKSEKAESVKRSIQNCSSKRSDMSDMRSVEEQRNQQRVKAMEAEQRARELREEIKKLDSQRLERDLVDAAVARICGEMIIDQVDCGIRDIYSEYLESERKRVADELAQNQYFAASQKHTPTRTQQDQSRSKSGSKHRRSRDSRQPAVATDQKFVNQFDQLADTFDAPISQTDGTLCEPDDENKTVEDLVQGARSPRNSLLERLAVRKQESRKDRSGSFNRLEQFSNAKSIGREVTPERVQLTINLDEEEQKQGVPNIPIEELFIGESPPIPFRPRRGNQLDMALATVLRDTQFMLPVEHIRNQLYLVGPHRVNLDFKHGSILVKKGGGAEKLQEYLKKNGASMQSIMLDYLIRSDESLEWVVQQLKLGNKIPSRKDNFLMQMQANAKVRESQVKLSESGFLSMASPSEYSRRTGVSPTAAAQRKPMMQGARSPTNPYYKRESISPRRQLGFAQQPSGRASVVPQTSGLSPTAAYQVSHGIKIFQNDLRSSYVSKQ